MNGGVSQVRILLMANPEHLCPQHWTQQQWQTYNEQMATSYNMPSMVANATVNLLGAKKEAAKVRWSWIWSRCR